jgi:hypothetical protein
MKTGRPRSINYHPLDTNDTCRYVRLRGMMLYWYKPTAITADPKLKKL